MRGTGQRDEDRANELALPRLARAIAQETQVVHALINASLAIEWISPSIRSLAGHEAASLVGTFALDLLHPDDAANGALLLSYQLANPSRGENALTPARSASASADLRVRTADGGWKFFEVTGTDCFADPDVRALLCTLRDVSKRRKYDLVLKRAEAGEPASEVLEDVAGLVAQSVPLDNLVAVIRRDCSQTTVVNAVAHAGDGARVSVFIEATPSLWADLEQLPDDAFLCHDSSLFPGYQPSWVPVTTVTRPALWAFPILTPATHETHETHETHGAILVWSPHHDGPTRFERDAIIGASRLGGLAIERDRLRQALVAAIPDRLTGAPEQVTVASMLESMDDEKAPWAMISIGLDGFQATIDALGHVVGVAVLVEVSNRIAATLRPGDTVARTGGDEFTVVCRGLTGEGDAHAVADRVMATIKAIRVVRKREVTLSAIVAVTYTDSSGRAHRLP